MARFALEREFEQVKAIQARMLPPESRLAKVRRAGVDVAIGCFPCSQVGGDYVDVLEMPNGRILLLLADVVGKGMPAALVASGIHSLIHMGIASGMALAEVVWRLNRQLGQTLAEGDFVTMAAIALDPRSGRAECVNMGHPPPLLIARDGSVRRLHAEHAPLGIEPHEPRPSTLEIHLGELLLLYSDGITDLRNERRSMWGSEGMEAALRSLRRPFASSAILGQSLRRAMDTYRGNLPAEDDRSFLAARLAECVR